MSTRPTTFSRVSRRTLNASSLTGAAARPLGPAHHVEAAPNRPLEATRLRRQAAAQSPEGWRTWYLTSPDEIRPAAPAAPSQAEIDELLRL